MEENNINKNKKLPFDEEVSNNCVIRTFDNSLNENELVWHRDKEDRVIFPLHESDWKIQLDNDIPQELNPDNPIFIESKKFHRLIKGKGDLKVKVYKTDLSDGNNLQKVISETLELFLENRGKSSRTNKGKKVPGKYLTSKSKNKRSQMKKEIDKFANKKSSDPSAYTKQWKADKDEKTKKSAATLAYQKMYGEGLDTLIKDKKNKLVDSFNKFKEAASREKKETVQAFKICKKILAKKDVTKEEVSFLKEQSKDLGKIVGVMALGSVSMAIPIALENILNKKYGISIMPSSQGTIKESKNNDKGLKNKAKSSGISFTILKQVYNRGMAAWRTGHRPGVAQNQWAMGRVNSFITGSGGARKADSDLWAKAKKSKAKKKKK
tara:strand:- start:1188 stop:2327 length:1140 start_codon:yes stop_codon:yes gene_type:complete